MTHIQEAPLSSGSNKNLKHMVITSGGPISAEDILNDAPSFMALPQRERYRIKKRVKRQINREAYRKEQREGDARRLKNPQIREKKRVCNKFRRHVREQRDCPWFEETVGCTVAEFRAHIEDQWLPGMSWENWSPRGWHIDHIQPLKNFDLLDPVEVKKAMNYKNTQPLWANDNWEKMIS